MALRGDFQQMRVIALEERAQQLWIIRPDSRANARPPRECRPPCPNFWRLLQDAEVGKIIEYVKVPEDRREHGIHEAEPLAGEERPRAECGIHAREFRHERLALALEGRCVGRCFQSPEISEDR